MCMATAMVTPSARNLPYAAFRSAAPYTRVVFLSAVISSFVDICPCTLYIDATTLTL